MDNNLNNNVPGTETRTAPAGTRKTVTGLTMTALFAAFIAAGTFISIPLPFTPVPIVMQDLFALLAGLILGPVRGMAAVAVYLVAGIIGAPVFAGATGGLARLLGPTGGFLIGYLCAAGVAGLIVGRPRPGQTAGLVRIIVAVVAGMELVYVPGLAWLKISTGGTWAAALAGGFLPFIPGTVLKSIVAIAIAPRLRRVAGLILSP
jgi:biotin transport system substrate-specific component